ncbi:uncharacterized protein LOC123988905 [Osmia bicornis bicornis]|uniref:uncharacterized protein LOC123988905 n=1 Tax=Osmia bicornis bicornis TaxID=1437191 RepID=UPI001EAEEA6F|nr:uncharacterized protein LOC123988905 [Osmia bicornis bicornis]
MATVIQCHLNRSQVADNLLTQLSLEMGADVVVISEQYRNRDCSSWYVDDLGVAALWVRDLQKVPVVCRGAGRGFVWAKSRDATYVSVYLSPNDSTCVFLEKLDDLEDALRDMNGGLVVAGDFNARALEWGMPAPNTRGKLVMEMASRLGLIVLNTGTTPTYRRPGFGDSIPDVTLVSECLGRRAVGWRVMEDFTGSDHQYITFQISSGRAAQHRNPQRPLGWNTAKLGKEKFAECLSRGLGAYHPPPAIAPIEASLRPWSAKPCGSSLGLATPRSRGKSRGKAEPRHTGGRTRSPASDGSV